ncbi:MAG: hypothetical protein ACM3KR_06640 [Deltaproteobacteria bacterium]
MPFCPKCKCEFAEDVQICNDCGVELVAEVPTEAKEQIEQVQWQKVLNVASEEEASMIVELLKTSDIPAMSHSYEVLTFIRNPQGVDILVPQNFYEQAEELLKVTLPSEMDNEINSAEIDYITDGESEEMGEELPEENTSKASTPPFKIIVFILVAVLIGVILYRIIFNIT